MRTREDAVRLLAYKEACTDAAIEALTSFAASSRDPQVLSDLAAAYYIRAQRKDDPSDLVRALGVAEEAAKRSPALPEALFNCALAEEALGLTADASAAWDTLARDDRAPWAAEAREHSKELAERRAITIARQWKLNVGRLPDAVDARDHKAVSQLVDPFRAAAQHYVEETLLPQWAAGGSEKPLEMAEVIARALRELSGDRYLDRTVAAIRSARNEEQRAALREGHRALGEARRADRTSVEKSEALYKTAELAFGRARSPLRFEAMLGRVLAMSFSTRFDAAFALLRTIEEEARRAHYPCLVARAQSARGFVFVVQGRYLDALAEYAGAQSIYERVHDEENLAGVHTRKLGVARMIGDNALAWREVFQAQSHALHLADLSSQHLLAGETAFAAVALDQPAVGLHFQDVAVRLCEDALSANPDEAAIKRLRSNLGIALRGRAAIHALMSEEKAAQADLDRAIPLIGMPANPSDASIPIGFRARLAEVQAQTIAQKNPRGAIEWLTRAVAFASSTHYGALRASLLTQRAKLFSRLGNRPSAITDLEDAIEASLAEAREAAVFKQDLRKAQPDRLWSVYFSRPQEAYRDLIRLLVEGGDQAQAFAYAEKTRAYEPLQLALRRDALSPAFRELLRDDKQVTLDELKHLLPDETFLLQYCVLDDRTYVWIVWKAHCELQQLPVGNGAIEKWTAAIQKYAEARADEHFNEALVPPYGALLARPIARVNALRKAGTVSHVVIVPDRAMHGLPFAGLKNGDRYLIRDHAVSVVASATLYAFSLSQDDELSKMTADLVFLIGNPTFNATQDVARKLPPLDRAGSEVTRIQKVYEPLIKVEPRVKEKATVHAFFEFAPRSAIVHIAAHGVANSDVPSHSFILLAPGDNGSGALDAERLLKEWHLQKTRLVVLSACSSAGGTPVGPEGLAPLVRPLIAAGVPGVVGTLWNVSNSAATEELVVRFHQHYSEGYDAENALRLAQLDLIRDIDESRHAAWAWAPFQVIGHASSPFNAKQKEQRR